VSSQDRELGVELYNDVWRLLESREDDDELLHQAHASAYHWLKAPECEPRNRARSEWLCSRVYSVLGRAEPAMHHAQRCLQLCEQHPDNVEDWDLAFAFEALARAYRIAGHEDQARRYEQLGREQAEVIADPEDRESLLRDLSSL
jgi:hypothetical protein